LVEILLHVENFSEHNAKKFYKKIPYRFRKIVKITNDFTQL